MEDIIRITPLNGRYIELDVIGKVSFIVGDSGSGKTFVCELIRTYKTEQYLIDKSKTNISIDSIEVWDDYNNINFEVENKVIVIDRFDILPKQTRDTIINWGYRSSNRLIIISYAMRLANFSWQLFHTLEYDDDHFWMQQIES